MVSYVFVWQVWLLLRSVIRIEHGPYLQNLKETETTIVWMASKPSVGWVELAPDDSSTYYQKKNGRSFFDTTNGVKNTSLLHVVKISGLKTGYRLSLPGIRTGSFWTIKVWK